MGVISVLHGTVSNVLLMEKPGILSLALAGMCQVDRWLTTCRRQSHCVCLHCAQKEARPKVERDEKRSYPVSLPQALRFW